MEVSEINAITGEVTERDYTELELAQREVDSDEAAQRATAVAATEAKRQATIQAARDQALSLGFTEAMLDVMYPQLTEGA